MTEKTLAVLLSFYKPHLAHPKEKTHLRMWPVDPFWPNSILPFSSLPFFHLVCISLDDSPQSCQA